MTGPADPVLVACGHGTRDPAGRRAIAQLRLQLAAARPGLEVLAASVDVQKPALPDVVQRLTRRGRCCVVVPLLLSAGYHVHVDVAAAVAGSAGSAVAAGALGPDDVLIDVLQERLAACGAQPDDAIVLGAAGSSDARAVADVEAVAQALARRRGVAVRPAYLSAAGPPVTDAVAAARAQGCQAVTVAAYVLAPGFFTARLARAGADRVSAPLAPHPALAQLALRRYDEAVPALRTCSPG